MTITGFLRFLLFFLTDSSERIHKGWQKKRYNKGKHDGADHKVRHGMGQSALFQVDPDKTGRDRCQNAGKQPLHCEEHHSMRDMALDLVLFGEISRYDIVHGEEASQRKGRQDRRAAGQHDPHRLASEMILREERHKGHRHAEDCKGIQIPRPETEASDDRIVQDQRKRHRRKTACHDQRDLSAGQLQRPGIVHVLRSQEHLQKEPVSRPAARPHPSACPHPSWTVP